MAQALYRAGGGAGTGLPTHTLTFATVLAVVRLWGRIRDGRGEYAS